MSNEVIKPIEQRLVDFHDDQVVAVVAKDGTIYVPVRPLCDLIGVDWSAQRKRINDDPVLSDVTMSVAVTATQIESARGQRKVQQMVCLPLNYLNGWLFGISAKRVKASIREKLIMYQKDCYNILFDAFSTGMATRHDDELMQSSDPMAIAFRNALANARLARETYYLTQRVDEHDRRLGLIEAQLSDTAAYVTQEQAQLVSEGVKAVAGVLSQRSGQNEYGGTYAELYRRFGVTSYKHIPTKRFDECISWLRQWWQELTDETDTPF